MSTGNWNVGGGSAGATGDLGAVRVAWESLELAADPSTDVTWMRDDPMAGSIARMVEALLKASHAVGPTWSMMTRQDAGDSDYLGGFYELMSGEWTAAGAQAVGAVDNGYSAHALLVMGAPHTDNDMVVRVTGASVTDAGTVTVGDHELLDTTGAALNQYFETSKRWVGEVAYSKESGTASSSNLGLCRYYNHRGEAFTVDGFEITGRAANNDNDFNMHLIHHKATGWTFNAGSVATPPTSASFVADLGAGSELNSGQPFAWERSGMARPVDGSAGEGIILRVTTTVAAAILHLNCTLRLD